MAKRRFLAPELVRLLELAPQPLYVLDDTLAIVFVNDACCAWLQMSAEELLDRQCAYNSLAPLGDTDAVVDGLCPPPLVLHGHEVTASAMRLGEHGPVYRRARFIPLMRSATDPYCILVLLDDIDAPEPSPDAVAEIADESLDLHLRLQRYRRQTALRYRSDRVIGVGTAMRLVKAQAEVAATSRASVLLVGPAGSGRRHLAEVIHHSGPTETSGMLTPIDCAMLTADLIRSTLLAAVSGPPAGSTGRNALLLCDADRLPVESHAALHAILSGERFPLRIMATTTVRLIDLATRGQYREELAGLLSTIAIELPPLIQRRADLPLLAQALLEERNVRGTKQVGGFTSEAMDCLCAYAWPGNVAELAEAVAACHIRAEGPKVKLEDLPERLRLAAEATARPRRKEEPIVLEEFTARIERELIRRALARTKGNKSKAARLLGMNRPRLYRKMVQLGLAVDEREGEKEKDE